MRRVVLPIFVGLVVSGVASSKASAADECSIRDSALCLANKNCHWDGSKPGCYPGPAPYVDPCSSHEGEAICASDDTLGCKWTAEAKKCESKTKPTSAK